MLEALGQILVLFEGIDHVLDCPLADVDVDKMDVFQLEPCTLADFELLSCTLYTTVVENEGVDVRKAVDDRAEFGNAYDVVLDFEISRYLKGHFA